MKVEIKAENRNPYSNIHAGSAEGLYVSPAGRVFVAVPNAGVFVCLTSLPVKEAQATFAEIVARRFAGTITLSN